MNDSNSLQAKSTQQDLKNSRGRNVSLGFKLPLIVLVLLALAFLVSTYLSIQATQDVLIETLQTELRAQAEDKAELIRAKLILSRSVAVDLAASAEVVRYERNSILNVIQNTVARNEQVFGAAIAYEPGEFQSDIQYWAPYYGRLSTGGALQLTQLDNLSYNYPQRDWYTQPKQQGVPMLMPPTLDLGGGKVLLVRWGVPFYNTITGEFRGVAIADIAFSQTQDLVNQISVGKGGYAFLLDPQGVVLGIGKNGGAYKPMESSMLMLARASKNVGWETLINFMLTDRSGFTRVVDMQGHPMYVTYTQIGMDTGWSLGLAYPENELLAKASQSQNTLVIYSSLVALVFGVLMYLFTLPITRPLHQLTTYAMELSSRRLQLTEGRLIEPIRIRTRDELEDLAEAFNQMAENVSLAFGSLEEKVQARTADLERNALEFATIAEVARDITILRDVDTLLNVSVNLIRERFNYYHVGIFLVDNRGEYAVLRAASSIGAQRMLEQNYKLRVGQEGLVGSVTRTGRAYIALDVGSDAVHFQNPYLPDTHSEITLPLKIHSVTIGALDIQTTVQSAFNERDLKVLQLLADQIAAAIQNAQLSEQVSETLAQINTVNALQAKQAWQTAITQRNYPAYEYDGIQIRPIPAGIPEPLLKKLESGKPIVLKDNREGPQKLRKTLMVPLRVLNQTIGIIGLEKENPEEPWTEDDIAVAEAAASRAALTLENTRLLEESQRRAIKERAIFEASGRVGSAMNIETILQTTAEEIEKVLNSTEVTLQFINDKKS